MQTTAHPLDEYERDEGVDDLLELDVLEMVRRLAAALDTAIDPAGDSRAIVAEALMRLAMGVHVYAAGPEATRDRALAMAMHTHPRKQIH